MTRIQRVARRVSTAGSEPPDKGVSVDVTYGLGERCFDRLSADELSRLSTRQVISRVISARQASETAARTARVIEEVLASRRPLDVELVSGDRAAAGEPVRLDAPLPAGRGSRLEQDALAIQLSESYRGGA